MKVISRQCNLFSHQAYLAGPAVDTWSQPEALQTPLQAGRTPSTRGQPIPLGRHGPGPVGGQTGHVTEPAAKVAPRFVPAPRRAGVDRLDPLSPPPQDERRTVRMMDPTHRRGRVEIDRGDAGRTGDRLHADAWGRPERGVEGRRSLSTRRTPQGSRAAPQRFTPVNPYPKTKC